MSAKKKDDDEIDENESRSETVRYNSSPAQLANLKSWQRGESGNPGGNYKNTPKVSNAYDRLLALSGAEFSGYEPKNKAETIAYNRIKEACGEETDYALPSTKEITDRTEGKSLARSTTEVTVNIEQTREIQKIAYCLVYQNKSDDDILAEAYAIIEARKQDALESAVGAMLEADEIAVDAVIEQAEQLVLGEKRGI